jgi:hypothetical protein
MTGVACGDGWILDVKAFEGCTVLRKRKRKRKGNGILLIFIDCLSQFFLTIIGRHIPIVRIDPGT